MIKIDKESALLAIEGCGGVIEEVSRRLGNVSWATARVYINKWDETKELFEKEVNQIREIADTHQYTNLDIGNQRKIKWIVARDTNRKSKGYVYFIKDTLLGMIKIGYAKTDYQNRLRTLQCGCPQQLILLAIIESDKASSLEKELQCRYSEYLYRGEWYSIPNEELNACIIYHEGIFLE